MIMIPPSSAGVEALAVVIVVAVVAEVYCVVLVLVTSHF